MARDIFSEVRGTQVRIRTPGDGSGQAITMTTGGSDEITTTSFPCKEWSITDDMMNVSDSASVTVANNNGENSGKFSVGQKIIIDSSDPDVAQGQWTTHFTGRITSLETYSDIQGGSNIMITAMDLGWHLTSCHGPTHKCLNGITFRQLIAALIDPSWGFGPTQHFSNDLNNKLKQGRKIISQGLNINLKAVYPFIQVEIGQAPFDILRTYLAREGLLMNVSAKGELVFFRPDYSKQALYRMEYHPTTEKHGADVASAPVGRPSLRESIDGYYSIVECWSTKVEDPRVQPTDNPNAMFTHDTITLSPNPLPFKRRFSYSDSEAISSELRKTRAKWKAQIDAFNSWEYTCEFPRHSQNGAFFVSDELISIDDTVNKIPSGNYYVQRVQRSLTVRDGARTRMTIRKAGLLNPALTVFPGGTKNSSQPHKAVK